MIRSLGALRRFLAASRDNFDRDVTGQLTDVIDVAGERDFTPERLRYYKDGTRRFLEYGTDSNYSETGAGHLLEPDSDQTLTLNTAERATYPVGIDLWPSLSRRLTQAPQAGDVVGGGYGVIDLANFDPSTETYSGSDADGYFWYHTASTGLDSVLLAGVRDGSIFDSRTVSLNKAASVLTIMEQRLNCYDVGPSLFRESFTDIANHPLDPQQNKTIGAAANDDGKGPMDFSHRVVFSLSQAAGNSGLGLEAGSVGVKASANPSYKFKNKGHRMTFDVTNGTDGTYQVVGAIRSDNDRPTVQLRVNSVEIVDTPGSSVTNTEVLFLAVDPAETDADSKTFTTPREHNPANSVVEIVEDNSITGPVEDDAGTGISGPTTSNTMTDPGGYQLGRETVTSEGTGASVNISRNQQVGQRTIYDTDICLVLLDASATGTCEIDVQTAQNS